MARNKVAPSREFKKSKNDSDLHKKNNTTGEGTIKDSFFISKKPKDKSKIKNNSTRSNYKQQNLEETKTNKSKFKEGKVKKNNEKSKKPFDKKKWRLQTYSKKYKLQQWEEKRKKVVLREYYKQTQDEKSKLDVQKIYDQYSDSDEDQTPVLENIQVKSVKTRHEETNQEETAINPKNKSKRKNIAYNKARHEFDRLKQEKLDEKQKREQQKAEKEEALKIYKKKKNEKFKKLNKKTKRGQPIMKDRIEMLLAKIQSS